MMLSLNFMLAALYDVTSVSELHGTSSSVLLEIHRVGNVISVTSFILLNETINKVAVKHNFFKYTYTKVIQHLCESRHFFKNYSKYTACTKTTQKRVLFTYCEEVKLSEWGSQRHWLVTMISVVSSFFLLPMTTLTISLYRGGIDFLTMCRISSLTVVLRLAHFPASYVTWASFAGKYSLISSSAWALENFSCGFADESGIWNQEVRVSAHTYCTHTNKHKTGNFL